MDKSLKSNTGRARLNINGAIDIDHLGIVVDFAESVNAQSSLTVLRTLELKHPEAEKVYVYCDNARYYRCSLVQEAPTCLTPLAPQYKNPNVQMAKTERNRG